MASKKTKGKGRRKEDEGGEIWDLAAFRAGKEAGIALFERMKTERPDLMKTLLERTDPEEDVPRGIDPDDLATDLD